MSDALYHAETILLYAVFCIGALVGFMAYIPAPVAVDGWTPKPQGGWAL